MFVHVPAMGFCWDLQSRSSKKCDKIAQIVQSKPEDLQNKMKKKKIVQASFFFYATTYEHKSNRECHVSVTTASGVQSTAQHGPSSEVIKEQIGSSFTQTSSTDSKVPRSCLPFLKKTLTGSWRPFFPHIFFFIHCRKCALLFPKAWSDLFLI